MATFKVGQRVRITGARYHPELIGQETTITSQEFWWFGEPGYKTAATDAINWLGVRTDCLAPLTDPDAEKFIERIKRMEREPQPLIKEKA